jgi:Class II flagellar assembly regulator
MRVEGNRPIRPTTTRRDDKTAGSGAFAEVLGSEPAAAPAKASPIGSLGALFALQEVADPTAQRRKAVARATRLLDRLGDLQLGLLDGEIDQESLADLASTARAARDATDDPNLQQILDEIELRAAVELAKLSSAP